eukprot:GFYU01001317.1.p1 GENE.GFYU01001317.1~~GFYU01001317.1.p1  ORF type:complete len:319 (+),score=78.15 GFYU01001317.1:172-1128(+)
MATRNRTQQYVQARNACRSHRKSAGAGFKGVNIELNTFSSGKNKGSTSDRLLDHAHQPSEYDVESGPGQLTGLPPEWLDHVEEITQDFSRIKTKMTELGEAHGKNIFQGFDDDDTNEQIIEITTQEISRLFRKCEARIKQITTHMDGLTQQDKQVRKNIQISLATQLQDLSVKFRKSQKDYLQRMRKVEGAGGSQFQEVEEDNNPAFDRGFDDEQMMALQSSEQNVEQREKEIMQVAKSINELSEIFKELAVLVIDQGTVLDRIDYNIEQVAQKMDASVVELRQAEEYQKKSKLTLCVMLLILMIGIMMLIMVFKILL